MSRRFHRVQIGCAALALAAASAASGQDRAPGTHEVFERFASRVVKIEVTENESAAKAVIGSGFFVDGEGRIATNFHVVSKLIHDPDRYRALWVDREGESRPVSVQAVDVVHDLAILRAGDGDAPGHFLALSDQESRQGLRLYSLGYPHDIGLSIVEGTYNGLLDHTLYEKIHFTGSLNPGMSGGPTLTEVGRVVGVNVSTAGNQVSFLVPAKRIAALLAATREPGFRVPEDFLAVVAEQIHAYQNEYLEGMLEGEVDSVELGPFRMPTRPAPFFNCWADAAREEQRPFQLVDHQCSTDDRIFIANDLWSGVIRFRHRLLTSDELGSQRFYKLYTNLFRDSYGWLGGTEEDVTRFRCESDLVEQSGAVFKAVFCTRRYRKLERLYDVVFKAASLGEERRGVETTLVLSGVSFENGHALARRYLAAIEREP
jgi:S1-C subfamily serine protease